MTAPSYRAGSQPSSCLLNPDRPVRSLSITFLLWKAFLFLVIVGCPGPGYDTSTSLLPYRATGVSDVIREDTRPLSIPLKFVRWDSIYFVHIAEKGYVFEQEWAFGYGYTQFLALLNSVFYPSDSLDGAARIAAVAVVLSHIAHYLSVISLYKLSINVFGNNTPTQKLVSFLSATLHIISPAGAFLSAPYGESLFSFLNISGFYLYSSSLLDDEIGQSVSRDVKLLLAAILFSAATTVRSNGILSGILFAYDALLQLSRIVNQGLSLDRSIHLGVILVGGCVIGLGMAVPQLLAYISFCMSGGITRPWCEWSIPSIYGWVQEQYWNVGFLRYWTVSNIPLFLLAMPMLVLLTWSSLWAMNLPFISRKASNVIDQAISSTTATSLLARLAIIQGLLAVLAFTSYHVQIINRISSGYPLWYWYLASQLASTKESQSSPRHNSIHAIAVQSMMVYGLLQAVLFGSFLPPA